MSTSQNFRTLASRRVLLHWRRASIVWVIALFVLALAMALQSGLPQRALAAAGAPPTISKSFSADNVALSGTVFVQFSINNPNDPLVLTGIAFTDTLPAGLIVATPNGLGNDCGGTVTAAPGSAVISLTDGSLGALSNCTVLVNLKVTTTGDKTNITDPITSNESGPGSASNSATIHVVVPPTVSKAFDAAIIPVSATTTLSFTLANPNAVILYNFELSDNLPSGLVVASPNNANGSCLTAAGDVLVPASVTANPGSHSINLSSLALFAGGSCSFSVDVTGAGGGQQLNTSGNVSASFDDGTGTFVGITGGTATASITVVAPPAISKTFNPNPISVNSTSTLTVTISNPPANSLALTGVAFTDALPSGILVANSPNLSNTCGGTATANAGSGSVSLSGGTLVTNTSCTVAVSVTALRVGNFTNTTSVVSSSNGGTGNAAQATLSVNKIGTAVLLSSAPNPSKFGQSVVFTATVAPTGTALSAASPQACTLDGSVTFKDGASTLGNVNLDANCQATFSTASLAIGTHTISAEYSGDPIHSGATSNVLLQIVKGILFLPLIVSH